MNVISKGKGIGGKMIRKAGGVGPGLSFSAISIVENSAQGTAIATLTPTNASNPGAISIAAQEVANLFQMNVDGVTLEVGSNTAALDYETRTGAAVTLQYTDDAGTHQFLRTIQITDAPAIVITTGGELDTALLRVGDTISGAWVAGTYPDYNGNTVSESSITYYVDDVSVASSYVLQTGDGVGQAEVVLSATGADDLTYYSGISGITDFTFTPTDLEWVVPAGGGSVPDQFGTGDWSVADDGTNGDITITLTTLPADNGSAITDIQYRINGGTATSFGATTTGSYGVSGLTDGVSVSIEVRAVNGNGNGTWAAAKNVTPTGVPAAFTAGQWTLTDLTTGGDARIAISALPSANGSAITDLEYKKDAGAWTSLGGTTTGNYDLAIFTDGVSANVLIRAVNANGNGADSDTKSVTTTTAAGYTQNFIDTNGTGRVSTTTAPGNAAAFTASVWVRPFNTTNVGTLFSLMNGSGQGVRLFMFSNGGDLEFRWIIHDSAASVAWVGMSLFGGLAANTDYHAYLNVDLSGAGTFTFLINGTAPSISNITGPTTGSGTVLMSQAIDVTWKDVGGNDVWDGRISDLFFQTGNVAYSNFHDGSNGPTDITGVGSPFLLLGDTMTADERAGNTAQGWNDGFNIGSAGMSVLNGSYTDA